MPTIFTKIINGEIPGYKIFENDLVCAFLAKDQIQLGHVLVVPKIEMDNFFEVPEPYYSAVFQAAKQIAPAIAQATQCKRVGGIIAGWDVPHFHYHLVPMYGPEDISFERTKEYSLEEMLSIQQKILQSLN